MSGSSGVEDDLLAEVEPIGKGARFLAETGGLPTRGFDVFDLLTWEDRAGFAGDAILPGVDIIAGTKTRQTRDLIEQPAGDF